MEALLPDGATRLSPVASAAVQHEGAAADTLIGGIAPENAGIVADAGGPGLAASADSDDTAAAALATNMFLAVAASHTAGAAVTIEVTSGTTAISDGAAAGPGTDIVAGLGATAILGLGGIVAGGVAKAPGDRVAAAGGGGGDAAVSAPTAGSAAGALVAVDPSTAGVAQMAPASVSAAAGTGGLVINLVYDAQALAAPASFRTGMQEAANLLEAAIQDNITVNIGVGYGEIDGSALPGPNTSEGDDGPGLGESYASLRTLLASHETSTADLIAVNALPGGASLGGVSNFAIGTAEAKALGALAGTDPAIDGYVGMGTGFTGSTLIGGALHEITHAMGRVPGDTALALVRYTSPGTHDFTGSTPAAASYFSIDGGATTLANFGVNSDPSDFLNSPASTLTPNDPFDETIAGSALTSVDLAMMDVLGFQVAPTNFTVASGQTFAGTTIIYSGDKEIVQSGGTLRGTLALSGGYEIISAGGVDVGATISSGAVQNVLGSASAVVVYGGGVQTVSAGTGSGTTVETGGHQYVLSGGRAVGATLSGGTQIVAVGGVASGTKVSSGGVEVVRGTASGTIVDGGGNAYVYGTASLASVNNGGTVTVENGGIASGTTVSSGGLAYVGSGGVASGSVLGSHGRQIDLVGGVASGTTVSSGGVEVVRGTAGGTIVDAGGNAYVYGTASLATVNSGGNVTVESGGVASGGTISGGRVEVASGGSIGGAPITFAGGGTLQLDASTGFTGAIAGFAVPDRLDLRDIGYGSGITTTRNFTEAISNTSGTLTVSDGTHTASLTLLGQYTTSQFNLAGDLHGGTLVTDPPAAAGSFQTSFNDIALDPLLNGAGDQANPDHYSQLGAFGTSDQPPSDQLQAAGGQTLLPLAGSGDLNPLLPAPR